MRLRRMTGHRGSTPKGQMNKTEAKFAEAHAEVIERTLSTLNHLAARCKEMAVDAEGKVTNPFRDSTVTNLLELAEILPALNMTDDKALAKATTQITTELRNLDPTELRKSPAKRKSVAQTAEKIAADLEGAF